MDRIERIRTRIQRIENLCAEVRAELDELSKELEESQSRKAQKKNISLPTDKECQEEFSQLYRDYLAGNSKAVEDFVNDKSKDYLKVFCKANNIPVDIKKVSKERIAKEVVQRLAQRKAITGETFSR